MIKLTQGYRPNKHDKNTIVILDEVVDRITDFANKSGILLITNGIAQYEVSDQGNDMFSVSGV